jgi:beta-glucosidase
MSELPPFPEGFLWGSAVSGHQIEGGNHHSDWWHWELATPTQPHSGKAVDYWNRYEEDHALLQKMGHQAFRLGIEWARIQPQEGKFNADAITHYRKILQSLRSADIQICLTLHHWVIPRWFAQQGGWTNPNAPQIFMQYVDCLLREFSDFPTLWITFNEPMVAALAGYITLDFPPQKRSFRLFRRAVRNMLRAHALAYQAIHTQNSNARVGVAMAYPLIEPWGSKGLAGAYERLCTHFVKTWIYQAWDRSLQTGQLHPLFGKGEIPHLRHSIDFSGINYYFRATPRASLRYPMTGFIDPDARDPAIPTTDIGWQIYPLGIRKIANEVYQRFQKPIFITENGIADASDQKRPVYLTEHLRQIHLAIFEDQLPIEGYFHWSYIDNFEWNEGFEMKFGLVEVDINDPHLKRTPRPSAHLYSQIIRENRLPTS